MKYYKWYLATIYFCHNGEWVAQEEISISVDLCECEKAKKKPIEMAEEEAEWEAERLLKKYNNGDGRWWYDVEDVREDK